ncbi:bifunctional diguanylate cyclase/phosphodiesterase [Thiomicrospira sp. WB1]|uniref:putative bifunctional diguanylate cyclase/phosphodiesterase n=1 Tax=Thiomicrospira sp. WB1 TaxID=1685380 RepID=UPI000748371E|nr:EAL domain-containing protein [Thiomicrospira sp. WB1]KUJ71445.1 hypothetical protein AVO41_07915 [Thiomicrospira sp. WB1]
MKALKPHIASGQAWRHGLFVASIVLLGLIGWADIQEKQRLSATWQSHIQQQINILSDDLARTNHLVSSMQTLAPQQREALITSITERHAFELTFDRSALTQKPFELIWPLPASRSDSSAALSLNLPDWLRQIQSHLPIEEDTTLLLTRPNRDVSQPVIEATEPNAAWRTYDLRLPLNAPTTDPSLELSHAQLAISMPAHWPTETLPWLIALTGLLTALYLFGWTQLHRVRYQQQQSALNQQRFVEYVKKAHEAIILCDPNGLIHHWNPAAEALFGYAESDVLNKPIQNLLMDGNRRPHNVFRLLADQNEKHYEMAFIRKDFETIRCDVTATRFHHGQAFEYALFINDVTQHRRREAEIEQLALYDPLTGLENRQFFSQNVDSYLAQSPLDPSVVFLIDLDGFKQINDTLGHEFGDELLKIIGSRLNHSIRSAFPPPRLCRFGGDEFLVLLSNIDAEEAIETARRLLATLYKPLKIDQEEVHITASLGMAFYPEHGRTLSELLRHADSAMYEAKAKGKNTLAIYDNTIEARLSERLKIERGLRRALDDDELELYYQPQISAKTQQVTAVEALLRWEHPEIGPVSPDRFIAIAEQSSLILEIGHWVLNTAVQQLKAWQGTEFEYLNIAINVSSHQLEDPTFLEQVHAMMSEENVPFEKLEIELTERSIMSNAQDNVDMLYQIRAHGLTISVDDFGTGYSSLSYLKRFPLNILKVDKSFVDGLPNDEDDAAISLAIIKLAQSLNMKVIAEGVENQAQFDFLHQAGCDMVQGYHYCKPLPIHTLEAWMHHYDPVHAVAEPLLPDPQTKPSTPS